MHCPPETVTTIMLQLYVSSFAKTSLYLIYAIIIYVLSCVSNGIWMLRRWD